MIQQHTLNFRGRLISVDQPIVMGILNLTPDSFHTASRITSIDDAVRRVDKMLADGATIIDIGAASSRPGAVVVSSSEEQERLLPVLKTLIAEYPTALFSIDTWRADIARKAIDTGAHLINDISAGSMDKEMSGVVAKAEVPFVVMHMLGTPGDMPVRPKYGDVAGDILRYLVHRVRTLRVAGVRDIIIDPGFGFGKSVQNNFDLLKKLEVFRFLELPLMVGLSRKSMIWRTLDITPEEALNGTTALHMIALQKGARILRVHDVREAMQTIALYQQFSGEAM